MIRKVMQHGPSTLTVSLPRQWVKQWNISKGDEILIKDDGPTLCLECLHPGINDETVSFDISYLDRTSMRACVRSAYRLGYDTIEVKYKAPFSKHLRSGKEVKVIDAIRLEVNQLLGAEIISETKTSCIIKHLTGDAVQDPKMLLRRAFILIESTVGDLATALTNTDTDALAKFDDKHDIITKLVSYALRTLNKQGYHNRRVYNILHTTLSRLDVITDSLKYAARAALRLNKPCSPDVISILRLVQGMVSDTHYLAFTYDPARHSRIGEVRLDLYKRIHQLQAENFEWEVLFFIRTIPEILFVMNEALFGFTCLNEEWSGKHKTQTE